MDLVVDQVMQLHHIDIANRHLAIERLTRTAVHQGDLPRGFHARILQHLDNVALMRTVEDRRRNRNTAAEVLGQLEDLIVVHRSDVFGINFFPVNFFETFLELLRCGVSGNFQKLANLLAHTGTGPTQMSLQDLPNIHPRRHAKRVQAEVYRSTIF